MIFLSVDNLQYLLIVMKSSEMILSSTRMYILQSTSCEHSRELSEGNAGFAESRSIVCLSIPWCYPPPRPIYHLCARWERTGAPIQPAQAGGRYTYIMGAAVTQLCLVAAHVLGRMVLVTGLLALLLIRRVSARSSRD